MAVSNKTDLQTKVTGFTDGGENTAAEFRTLMTDMVDSVQLEADATTGLTAVQTDDDTIEGDGTSGNEVKVKSAGIDTTELADNAVTRAKLGNAAVGNDQLGTGAVESDNIKDSNVTAGKLADDAVLTDNIKDGNVTKAKLASDATVVNPNAFTGASLAGSDLTLSRQSGSDPVSITLPSGSGSSTEVTLGSLIHEFTWGSGTTGVTADQTDTDQKYGEAEYLIFEGWIGDNITPKYPFSTAVKRDEIPTTGQTFRVGTVRAETGNKSHLVDITLTAAGLMTLSPRGADSDFGRVRVWSSKTPTMIAMTDTQPYITEFGITGDTLPQAGDIGGNQFTFVSAVAHADQVTAIRVVGFEGTTATSVTALATILSGHFDHASGSFTIPANTSLDAGDVYTIRLEVYGAGQTVGTDTPLTFQDRLITAHAPATAAYHWGRVIKNTADADVSATAARVVFADDDTTTGNALASTYVVSVPDDANEYQTYLFAQAGEPQPTGFQVGGFSADNSWNDPVDITIGGTDFKAYILKANFAANFTEDNGRVWTILS